MHIGYARTSAAEQEAGLEAQERDLRAAGCQKVFAEQVSSVARRERLEAALDYVREGDTLIVTRPDRLARSTADLLALVARLEAKGVGLIILSMGGQRIDTANVTGMLTLTLLAAIAAFERDLMLERQREGIAKAKAAGKYRGRVPTARRQADAAAHFPGGNAGAATEDAAGTRAGNRGDELWTGGLGEADGKDGVLDADEIAESGAEARCDGLLLLAEARGEQGRKGRKKAAAMGRKIEHSPSADRILPFSKRSR